MFRRNLRGVLFSGIIMGLASCLLGYPVAVALPAACAEFRRRKYF